MKFEEKLSKIVQKNNSILSVGLDIDKEKMPKHLFKNSKDPFYEFNEAIINNTKDLVCAYKLNMAFYEALGLKGYKILKKTIQKIPKEVIIIIDGKRNDIGNSAKKYAHSIFEELSGDATTVNPYLGIDSVKPFLKYKNKCSFILCRTSNPSARDFQDLQNPDGLLSEIVANKIKEWNKIGCCGAVVGATYPNELKMLRSVLGEHIPILIPGIGAQGGDIKKTVINGTNSKGKMAIINSSRNIIYAGKDKDYAKKARNAAIKLRDEINKYR